MRILGLDGGIASIGWALIEEDEKKIIACGSRCFDAPETDKERTPTNQIRRQKRGMRRVIRRRRQRMAQLRRLLAKHGLIPDANRDALRLDTLGLAANPWRLRAEALDRTLSGAELAAVLGHIAAHRGFRSNSKRDRGANAADESSRMLSAIDGVRNRLGAYRSVGEMFARDPEFAGRKRNRDGNFDRSVLRDDLAGEVRELFAAQRRLGNDTASPELEDGFTEIAFFQRPLQDSDALVGMCSFVEGERRTARHAPSFELFRLLSRLNTLKLVWRGGDRGFTAEELSKVAAAFGTTKKLTFKALRRMLDIDPAVLFDGVKPDEESRDVVARAGNAAEGTATFREALGPDWAAYASTPEILDRAAEIITFRDDLGSIRKGLDEAGLRGEALTRIMEQVEAGAFRNFKGAAHISAAAARVILPGLRRGLVYSEACAEAGYDHAAQASVNLDDIRNPVARKALGEMLNQVRAIVREHGRPDMMHVELARDVGKSAEERDKITAGIEKKNKERDRARLRFRELLRRDPAGDDMQRFELWEEQNGRCLYTDSEIPAAWVSAGDNRVQVDHILPWSRFGDDSFLNKTLCMAGANQKKKGRTPFEWFSAEMPDRWDAYVACVEGCKSMKGAKKRGFYLRRNATEVEEKFRNRNLGDTRYATRALMESLKRLYPEDDRVHVRARPGALTSKLRRGWGLQGLKKDAKGERLEDDRHHALDAIVLAATSESMVNSLTRAFQEAEQQGRAREFSGEFLEAPWPGFRLDAEKARDSVLVSRPERRKIPGEAHAATIKQVREIDGQEVVCVRKVVEKLEEKDLDAIPVPKPYGRIADPVKLRDLLVESLRDWIAKGKPKDALPRGPNGDVVRKVRVKTGDKPGVSIRGGTADRGDMARVDVFRERDAKGRTRFHLVPVYPHQIVGMEKPPMLAIVAAKPESEWTPVDRPGFEFRFSLYQNSLVEVTKPDGEMVSGYFKGVDRSVGALSLADTQSQTKLTRGIGAKTLLSLRKFNISRLGEVSEILQESRTWRGAVCT